MTPIYLIDISAYLHRAMHAVYGDRAALISDTDTNFIDHTCVMLANTMERLRIQRMAVVCDSVEPSFRCELLSSYKSERKAHTPVFSKQAPRFFDALRDIDVTVYLEDRYEADDLIATLCGQEEDTPYTIVTHDKDLLALVNDEKRIAVYNPMNDVWVRSADVVKKLEVLPSQVYDYLGLVGDTSDGIPGVDGIGAKTAAKLLAKFGSMDNLYADEAALQASVGRKQFESLMINRQNAFLSRQLAQPIISDEIALTGHDAMNAPDADFVRGATLTTSRKIHNL